MKSLAFYRFAQVTIEFRQAAGLVQSSSSSGSGANMVRLTRSRPIECPFAGRASTHTKCPHISCSASLSTNLSLSLPLPINFSCPLLLLLILSPLFNFISSFSNKQTQWLPESQVKTVEDGGKQGSLLVAKASGTKIGVCMVTQALLGRKLLTNSSSSSLKRSAEPGA